MRTRTQFVFRVLAKSCIWSINLAVKMRRMLFFLVDIAKIRTRRMNSCVCVRAVMRYEVTQEEMIINPNLNVSYTRCCAEESSAVLWATTGKVCTAYTVVLLSKYCFDCVYLQII